MYSRAFLVLSAALLFVIGGCRREGCTDANATNYDSKANREDHSCVYPSVNQTTVFPENYSFERNGSTSVDFGTASILEEMDIELMRVIKAANTPGTAPDDILVYKLLHNEDAPFTDNKLNESGYKLSAFMGGGDPFYSQALFKSIDSVLASSKLTLVGVYAAGPGKGGVMKSGNTSLIMNANGLAYTEWIEMAILCLRNLHYIQYTALGAQGMGGTMGEGVENAQLADGKNYTEMEHSFDMAYGMFSTQTLKLPDSHTAWGLHAADINPITASFDRLFNYFIRGRYAITQKDMKQRNTVISEIKYEMDRICVALTLYHLAEAKKNVARDFDRNRHLSRASGLVWGMQFLANNPPAKATIDGWLIDFGTDFYKVDAADIDAFSDLLASRYNLVEERNRF
jgi:hypothetical protein